MNAADMTVDERVDSLEGVMWLDSIECVVRHGKQDCGVRKK
jgi:hypothetical protein